MNRETVKQEPPKDDPLHPTVIGNITDIVKAVAMTPLLVWRWITGKGGFWNQ